MVAHHAAHDALGFMDAVPAPIRKIGYRGGNPGKAFLQKAGDDFWILPLSGFGAVGVINFSDLNFYTADGFIV